MGVKIGDIVGIGPKVSIDRLYRILSVEDIRHGLYKRVHVTNLTDESTWSVTVKANAKNIHWNARLSPIPTIETPETKEDTMSDSLNISDRVKWSEYVDDGPPVTQEGEVFEFSAGGYVTVYYQEGTTPRSRTMHRDRLTKI